MTEGFLADIEIGEEFHGSIVTLIDQEVNDGPEKYHIKRKINLANGTQMKDEFWREKKKGGRKYETGVTSLDDPNQVKRSGGRSSLINENAKMRMKKKSSPKDREKRRSSAREQARALMQSRPGRHKSTDSLSSSSSNHSYIDDMY